MAKEDEEEKRDWVLISDGPICVKWFYVWD